MSEPDHIAGLFAPSESPECARLRWAVMELVLKRGWEGVTVDEVLARAEMERADFDAIFDGLDDCGVKIFEANIDSFDLHVFGAPDPSDPWRDRLRAVAYAAARYVRDRPIETAFDVTQVVRIEMAGVARDRYMTRIVELIDEGRRELDDPDSVGRGVAEMAVGAVFQTLTTRMGEGNGSGAAEDFVPELMFIAVRPYVGNEVAREELETPPPPEWLPPNTHVQA